MKYSHNADQISIFNFGKVLKVNLDKNHELVKMEALVPWDELVDAIANTYKDTGRPSKSIRLMLGLLIIKHKHGIADEELIERLKGDIYFQYFCGFDSFIDTDSIPDSSSLTYFRKRLTPEILQKIENAIAIKLIKKLPKKRRHSIMVDTTCMPANVTFPTDTKLLSKTYEKLVNLGKSIGLKVIRGKRKIKAFIRGFNLKRNKTKKEIIRARKKLVRATKGLLKKIKHKIGQVTNKILEIAEKIIEQQDKRNKGKTNIIENRIVSFHEPTVRPIKRGKDGANCEFGKKVAITVIGEGITVSTKIDNNNFDDREIIKAAIEKHNRLTERDPTEIIMDRGGDSKKNHDELKERRIKDGVQRKGRQKEKPTRVQKRQHNRRSVVEGKIGTGKQFYGLNKNKYREKNAEVWLTFGLAAMNLTWATRKAA
jgi:IS5 family transposase